MQELQFIVTADGYTSHEVVPAPSLREAFLRVACTCLRGCRQAIVEHEGKRYEVVIDNVREVEPDTLWDVDIRWHKLS